MAQRVVIPGFRKIETSSGGGEGGTTNYNDLTNKPSINNVPLVGNLNTVDLKLTDSTLTEEGVPAEAKTVGTKLAEQSTSLTALSNQLGNNTVKSDVPENAVFTDTVYDDTEVKGSIEELNSNLDTLEFGDVAGGKNLLDINKVLEWINRYTNGTYSNDILTISPINSYLFNNPFQFSDVDIDVTLSVESFNFVDGSNARINLLNSNNISVGEINSSVTTISVKASKFRINFTTLPTSIILDKLMLQLGTTATQYEPYIPSVKMLSDEVNAQNESLGTLGKCKNLLNPTLQNTTINGITCTNNGDGTYTVNGTATNNVSFSIYNNLILNKPYKLVGCVNGGSIETYSIYVEATYERDYGNGVILNASEKIRNVTIMIKNGTTCNNLLFKPMLTTNLNATYDDFVPYTGDGDTLMDDVASINNDLGGLSFSVSDGTLSITDGTNTWTLQKTT